MLRQNYSCALLVFIVAACFSLPANAFVSVINAVGSIVMKANKQARWGDLIDADKLEKQDDFAGAYKLLRSEFLTRIEKEDANRMDAVHRLTRLVPLAALTAQSKDFDEFLTALAPRFEADENPLVRAYYLMLRADSAQRMNRAKTGKVFRQRALELTRGLVEKPMDEWGFFRKFGADFFADSFSRQLELNLYLHFANNLLRGAIESLHDGQESEALDMARQSSEFVEKYFVEVKRINDRFVKPAGANKAEKLIPYFAYYAGVEKSEEAVITSLSGVKPTPADMLSDFYLRTGRADDAEIMASSLLTGLKNKKEYPLRTRLIAVSLLVQSLLGQGKAAQAEALLVDEIGRINAVSAGADDIASEGLALLQVYLAESRLAQSGKEGLAREAYGAAVALMKARLSSGEHMAYRGYYVQDDAWRDLLTHNVTSLARAGDKANIEQIFEAAQLAKEGRVAEVLGEVAARFSSGEGELSVLVRKQQDLRAELKVINTRLSEFSSGETPQSKDLLAALREEKRGLLTGLASANQALSTKFPEFVELTRSSLLPLPDAQRLLAPDEAMLTWLVGDKESVLLVIKQGEARSFVIPEGRLALRRKVAQLRENLDPETGDARKFDAGLALDIYRTWVQPAEVTLGNVKHLLAVTDDALGSIPLHVLISDSKLPPAGPEVMTREALLKSSWLVRKYAISVLPGISSLKALRQTLKGTQGGKPFLGIGDPLFSDHPTLGGTPTRGARGLTALRLFRGGMADQAILKNAPSLPETSDELQLIRQQLGADSKSLLLREAATETNVRSFQLADYRVIAFATHGVVAGDIRGVFEPGLLLTPPALADEKDDGVLTASEVATLKLDADWVLLSACNTAAGDGKPGSEGLSGLGKAFFYAGARSLLLSHWSVPSESTTLLTTRMFQFYTKPGVSKAEAQRQSMLSLIDDKSGKFAHPSFWAPFVIVGDGGQLAESKNGSSFDPGARKGSESKALPAR